MSVGNLFFPVTVPYQGPGRNQSYGQRTSGRMHHGVDFTPPIPIQPHHRGFGIIAYRGGTVVEAQDGHGLGIVKIQHDDGTFARYLHNSAVRVAVGSIVSAGQHIANMGNLGTFAPHLHFELLDSAGNSRNPHPYLLDARENPLGTLVIISNREYGPPRSEGGGL